MTVQTRRHPLRLLGAICVVLCCAAVATAQQNRGATPVAGSSRPVAVAAANPNVSYVYREGVVYSVAAGLGIATQVVLDPAEKIMDFGTGFSAGWDIVRRDHIFYLKPKDPDAETNMYIRTDRRSYIFDLKIVSKDWRRIDEAKLQGVMYLVQFEYPDNLAALRRNRLEQAAAQREALASLGRPVPDPSPPKRSPYLGYYTDYESTTAPSAKWLVPLRVYDDGAQTFVQFADGVAAPAFFGRMTDRGEEFVLNSQKQGAVHAVFGVFPFLIIRYGSEVIAVRRR